jgi:hypothetical protein
VTTTRVMMFFTTWFYGSPCVRIFQPKIGVEATRSHTASKSFGSFCLFRHCAGISMSWMDRNDADGLGSAGVLARRLRRLAEGIIALAVAHLKVNPFEPDASRRDADWRRSRRSRSHFSNACHG